jgi:aryl-alcohol dehydrogenase-like predicted oxidoreductase
MEQSPTPDDVFEEVSLHLWYSIQALLSPVAWESSLNAILIQPGAARHAGTTTGAYCPGGGRKPEHQPDLTWGAPSLSAMTARRARLRLAWVLAKGPNVVPIPGTKQQRYLAENLHALAVALTPAEIAELDALRPAGDRMANEGETNRTTVAR